MPKAKRGKKFRTKVRKELITKKPVASIQKAVDTSVLELEGRLIMADIKRTGILTGVILVILILLYLLWH